MKQFIQLKLASSKEEDGIREYTESGSICINVDSVTAYYNHKILTEQRMFTVMETRAEITKLIREVEQ